MVRNLLKSLNLPLFQMALSSKMDLQLDNRTRIISSRNMTATQRRINCDFEIYILNIFYDVVRLLW